MMHQVTHGNEFNHGTNKLTGRRTASNLLLLRTALCEPRATPLGFRIMLARLTFYGREAPNDF